MAALFCSVSTEPLLPTELFCVPSRTVGLQGQKRNTRCGTFPFFFLPGFCADVPPKSVQRQRQISAATIFSFIHHSRRQFFTGRNFGPTAALVWPCVAAAAAAVLFLLLMVHLHQRLLGIEPTQVFKKSAASQHSPTETRLGIL